MNIAFYLDDVAEITDANETFENWKVSFTTPGGEVVTNWRVNEPMINRTLGYLQSNLIKKTV